MGAPYGQPCVTIKQSLVINLGALGDVMVSKLN